MLANSGEMPANIFECGHANVSMIAVMFFDCHNIRLSYRDADEAADAVCEQLEYDEIFFLGCHRLDPSYPVVKKTIDLVSAWMNAEAPPRLKRLAGGGL